MKLHFPNHKLCGTINIPGDKSISHRALMLGAIAHGKTKITNFLAGADCLSTMKCLHEIGVTIEKDGDEIIVFGQGFNGLTEAQNFLNVGNSGTTIRLMMGLLGGVGKHFIFVGDNSIAKRPMKRVTAPLRQMGVKVKGNDDGNFTPITVFGKDLKAISFKSSIASAQVKSAILLAGLQAEGETVVEEIYTTRNHTELMIAQFGGKITCENTLIRLPGKQKLIGCDVFVPGDISSAAFWLVAGAITPNSRLTLRNVGLNETRTGIIDVMKKMGANIEIEKTYNQYEPIGNITISTSNLVGTNISGKIIPRLIDELPVIALLATQAEGKTVISDSKEMRVKETDRISVTTKMLKKLGADITETEDGFIINGKTALNGAKVDSYHDHRIGMMLSIAALITSSPIELENSEAISISYPTFFNDLKNIVEGKL